MHHRMPQSEIEIAPAPPLELIDNGPSRPYFVRPRVATAQKKRQVVRGSEDVELSIGWCFFLDSFVYSLGCLVSFRPSFLKTGTTKWCDIGI